MKMGGESGQSQPSEQSAESIQATKNLKKKKILNENQSDFSFYWVGPKMALKMSFWLSHNVKYVSFILMLIIPTSYFYKFLDNRSPLTWKHWEARCFVSQGTGPQILSCPRMQSLPLPLGTMQTQAQQGPPFDSLTLNTPQAHKAWADLQVQSQRCNLHEKLRHLSRTFAVNGRGN